MRYNTLVDPNVNSNQSRNSIATTDQLFSAIAAAASSDHETGYQLRLFEIERAILCGDYSVAFVKTESTTQPRPSQSSKLASSNLVASRTPVFLTTDVAQRLGLLLARAKVYAEAGAPEKGFSITVRAADRAFSTMLLPLLWEAVGVLANILNALSEFEAAEKLLSVALPKVNIPHYTFNMNGG